MRKKLQYKSLILIYLVILSTVLLFASIANKAITVITVNAPIARNKTVIIDAGHGGVDGGAISCTGVSESKINLEIALKLNDLSSLLHVEDQPRPNKMKLRLSSRERDDYDIDI